MLDSRRKAPHRPLSCPEDIACGDLALAFGDDPMLDADPSTGEPIWPACNVARREDAGYACLKILVDRNAAVGEARLAPPAQFPAARRFR